MKLGENVKGFHISDRITADQIVPCGECRFCKSGRYWMCQPQAASGFQKGNNGGISKHAVDRAGITNEDAAVISGAGTLGLGMVIYAPMKNPAKLIVLDMNDKRLEKAEEFGADVIMNPGKENMRGTVCSTVPLNFFLTNGSAVRF